MAKEKKYIRHFLVIGGGTMANMLIALITTPLITRLADPREYGQLSIFTMYAGIAEMFLCLGLDQALVRYYYENNSVDEKRGLLLQCIMLPVIVTCLCGVIFVLFVAGKIVDFDFNLYYTVWLAICVLIQIVNRFSFLCLRLEYKSKAYSFLRIFTKLSYLALVAIPAVLVKNHFLNILVVATVLSTAICTAIGVFLQSNLWKFHKNDIHACRTSMRDLLVYALPFIVSTGVTQIFQALDKISLNMYRTYDEVGVYASTMTLVNIFNIVQVTFNALWGPIQVEHFTKNPEDHTLYQKGNQIITVIMFFIGISLILVKDIFAILLGEKYREAAYILPFLIFSPIMYTISETTNGGLVFMKKSNMQVVVAVVACLANLIGNTILVPELGCQGAAISTGLSYIVFFTVRTVLSNRYYYTNFRLKSFYLLTFATGVYAFYNTFNQFSWLSIVGYIVCLGFIIILYDETVKWMLDYVKQNSKAIIAGFVCEDN